MSDLKGGGVLLTPQKTSRSIEPLCILSRIHGIKCGFMKTGVLTKLERFFWGLRLQVTKSEW